MATVKITPIPIKFIDTRKVLAGIKRGMERGARLADADFKKTVKTWDHKPPITIEPEKEADYVVGTDDDTYKFVSGGTRAHSIFGALAFESAYQAKTAPGNLDARAGGASGPTVYAKEVDHPGISPRNFPDAVIKDVDKVLVRYVEEELEKSLL